MGAGGTSAGGMASGRWHSFRCDGILRIDLSASKVHSRQTPFLHAVNSRPRIRESGTFLTVPHQIMPNMPPTPSSFRVVPKSISCTASLAATIGMLCLLTATPADAQGKKGRGGPAGGHGAAPAAPGVGAGPSGGHGAGMPMPGMGGMRLPGWSRRLRHARIGRQEGDWTKKVGRMFEPRPATRLTNTTTKVCLPATRFRKNRPRRSAPTNSGSKIPRYGGGAEGSQG